MLFAQANTSYVDKANGLYALYDEFLKYPSSKDVLYAEEIANTIRHQVEGLKGREREGVFDVIVSDLINVFEEQDNNKFLIAAERALFIIPPEEPIRFDILDSMADIYAELNNRELLQATINQMKTVPGANSAENEKRIIELQSKANNLQRFPQLLNGYWIADRYMTAKANKGRPWLILDIYSNNNGKWAAISELSGITSNALEMEFSPLRLSNSFSFDVRGGTFLFSFNLHSTHQGNSELAHSYLDLSQDTQARFHALALDDRASFGESLAAGFIGGLMSGIYEGSAKRVATSTMSEDNVLISGAKVNDNAFKCKLQYQYQASNSATMVNTTQDYINQEFVLYRWNKNDNLVFGLPDCRPISPYLIKLTPDMELYQIKKKTSFWNFKYGGITLFEMAACVACSYYGISILTKEDKSNNDRTIGIVATALGSALTITVPIVMRSIRLNSRKRLVAEYNMREFNRLTKMKE